LEASNVKGKPLNAAMKTILLVACGFVHASDCRGQAAEYKDRMDQYVLAMDAIQDAYAVSTRSEVVLDFVATEKLVFERRTASYFWDASSRVSRFHGRITRDINGENIPTHYHAARFDDKWLVSGTSPEGGKVEPREVQTINNRGGIAELPFEILPFCNFTTLSTGRQYVEMSMSELIGAKWLDGKYDSNRRYSCTVLFRSGYGAAKVTFKDEPNWLPEEVVYLSHPKLIPIDVENASLASLEPWRPRSRTLCTWERVKKSEADVSKDVWVPQLLSTSERRLNGRDFRSWDMCFFDWKFAPDLDKSLCDITSFSTEYIRGLDFDDMESRAKELIENLHNNREDD
jgi:hypothetical protein